MPLSLLASLVVAGPFVVRPYVQLGAEAFAGDRRVLSVVWHAPAGSTGWAVKYWTSGAGSRWADAPVKREVRVGGIAPHDVFLARLKDLETGTTIRYTVVKDGKEVAQHTVKTPKGAGQPLRMVIAGDVGRSTPGQRAVAAQIWQQKPDAVLVTGDIVYAHGQMSEYRSNWFGQLNPPAAPLLSETLFIGVTGNHDTAYRNLGRYPDGLAYYAYWKQPLNGPRMPISIGGSAAQKAGLAAAAGPWLDKGGNFSFDLGDVHWTVIDSNSYANWDRVDLREWLVNDLRANQSRPWRFVAFHHPPYHSSNKKKDEVHMRKLTSLFNQYGVQMVFCGHVHNYQRTYPLQEVAGKIAVDLNFDGVGRARPNGTIFVVTGAGGAELYDQKFADRPETWKPWTAAYKAGYSFTLLDVNGREARIRQINSKGKVIDAFRVLRPVVQTSTMVGKTSGRSDARF